MTWRQRHDDDSVVGHVVQATWLRGAISVTLAGGDVPDPRAYLVRVVTRQAPARPRTLARRREDCVGECLPEPLLKNSDVVEDVEHAESVSIAIVGGSNPGGAAAMTARRLRVPVARRMRSVLPWRSRGELV